MISKKRQKNHGGHRFASGPRIAAVAAASALALTACSGGGGDGGSNADEKQVLEFGISNEPDDPIAGMNQGTVANTIATLIHRGLMIYDEDGKLKQGLASEINQSDPLTYEVKLEQGLTFHDGSNLTAENVKNSLEYYASKSTGSTLYSGMKDIKAVKVVDDENATITLKKPNSAFLEYLAAPYAAIVPDEALKDQAGSWIGAGPFSLKDHTNGVNMVLSKFDNYYDSDDVELDEIDFSFYADGEARTNALISGEVDMIDYVPWQNFDRISSTDGLTLDTQAGPFQHVDFNAEKGPFSKAKVRQAVAYAINRDNSVKAAFKGHAEPLYAPMISEDNPAYDPSMEKLWSYDPEKAKSLLAEAGYPDGFKATMLTTSQYEFLQDTALAAQADLKKIGIDVTLDAPDWPTRISKGNAGDYDLAIAGSTGVVADPTYLRAFVTGPTDYNRSANYNNKDLNAALDDGLRATDDSEKRAAYKSAFEIIQKDVPFTTITSRDQAFAYNSKVKGFKNLPGFLTFYSGYTLSDTSISENE